MPTDLVFWETESIILVADLGSLTRSVVVFLSQCKCIPLAAVSEGAIYFWCIANMPTPPPAVLYITLASSVYISFSPLQSNLDKTKVTGTFNPVTLKLHYRCRRRRRRGSPHHFPHRSSFPACHLWAPMGEGCFPRQPIPTHSPLWSRLISNPSPSMESLLMMWPLIG